MSPTLTSKRSVSKTIQAPAEKVFDSWLIPAVVGRWMFGPSVQAESIIDLSNNVRPKGDFTYKVRRGSKEVVISGVYHVIDRPRRLEFSWREDGGLEMLVQIQFESEATHTKMRISLKLDASLAAQADNIKQLWSTRSTLLATLLSRKA